MRSKLSFFFNDTQRRQLRIHGSRYSSEFRSCFHPDPENARGFCRREESVPAEHNLCTSSLRRGKRLFYLIDRALRWLAYKFKGHVQRFLLAQRASGAKFRRPTTKRAMRSRMGSSMSSATNKRIIIVDEQQTMSCELKAKS